MTYSNPQQGAGEEAKKLRQDVGRKLKALREAVGKTQRDIANEVGFDYYTMISQIENGKTRVPPLQMAAYARALQVTPADFGRLLLSHYDPPMFKLLFEKQPITDQGEAETR